jgi:hypothetical protein
MIRMDVYVATAVIAWLAGAYWVWDGLRAQAAATDRQTVAIFCTGELVVSHSLLDMDEQCETSAISQDLAVARWKD